MPLVGNTVGRVVVGPLVSDVVGEFVGNTDGEFVGPALGPSVSSLPPFRCRLRSCCWLLFLSLKLLPRGGDAAPMDAPIPMTVVSQRNELLLMIFMMDFFVRFFAFGRNGNFMTVAIKISRGPILHRYNE